jgi:hypothetical protein
MATKTLTAGLLIEMLQRVDPNEQVTLVDDDGWGDGLNLYCGRLSLHQKGLGEEKDDAPGLFDCIEEGNSKR